MAELTMEDRLDLVDFSNETNLLTEQLQRESVELSQFNLETTLIEKGVI